MNKLLYKDKDWLINQYAYKKQSTYQIAEECGCGCSTIRRWLIKFNISLRTQCEANYLARGNHCNITPELLEVINGQLLGDACLHTYSQYSAQLSWGQQHEEHIQYVKSTLTNFKLYSGGIYKTKSCNKKTNKSYVSYRFQTYSYVELRDLWKEWYPNGKKIVPRDIKLTPTVCLHWYLGDGSLNNGNARSRIVLSTYDFAIEDVEFLVEKIKDLGVKATRLPNNTIYIRTESTKDFLDYIGACPVACYRYKWNYQDNCKTTVLRGQYEN